MNIRPLVYAAGAAIILSLVSRASAVPITEQLPLLSSGVTSSPTQVQFGFTWAVNPYNGAEPLTSAGVLMTYDVTYSVVVSNPFDAPMFGGPSISIAAFSTFLNPAVGVLLNGYASDGATAPSVLLPPHGSTQFSNRFVGSIYLYTYTPSGLDWFEQTNRLVGTVTGTSNNMWSAGGAMTGTVTASVIFNTADGGNSAALGALAIGLVALINHRRKNLSLDGL